MIRTSDQRKTWQEEREGQGKEGDKLARAELTVDRISLAEISKSRKRREDFRLLASPKFLAELLRGIPRRERTFSSSATVFSLIFTAAVKMHISHLSIIFGIYSNLDVPVNILSRTSSGLDDTSTNIDHPGDPSESYSSLRARYDRRARVRRSESVAEGCAVAAENAGYAGRSGGTRRGKMQRTSIDSPPA